MTTAAAYQASRNEPTSHHVADSHVQPFLQRDFDPADYLNATLPPLSVASNARSTQGRSLPLPELGVQLQTLLSQLNAQTSRLSNTLTQLTDEIVRSGGRLAYEVEVLKGETTGLTDALSSDLKDDIELFAPGQVAERVEAPTAESDGVDVDMPGCSTSSEPEYLERLRTLTLVRSRLDSVIKVFGDAMAWPMAPSGAAPLISITAPENDAEARDREDKGRRYAEDLRSEINDLVGSGNDVVGLEAAATRLDNLQVLADVWKGTAEEKARQRLIESMQKPVTERLKALHKPNEGRKAVVSPSRGVDSRYGGADVSKSTNDSSYGFLQNLRNLKNEMYLD